MTVLLRISEQSDEPLTPRTLFYRKEGVHQLADRVGEVSNEMTSKIATIYFRQR